MIELKSKRLAQFSTKHLLNQLLEKPQKPQYPKTPCTPLSFESDQERGNLNFILNGQ